MKKYLLILLFLFWTISAQAGIWKSPTSHKTPTNWLMPERAYDGKVTTSYWAVAGEIEPWSLYGILELRTSVPILANEYKFYAHGSYAGNLLVTVGFFLGDTQVGWKEIDIAVGTTPQWYQRYIEDEDMNYISCVCDRVKIDVFNSDEVNLQDLFLWEFYFGQLVGQVITIN